MLHSDKVPSALRDRLQWVVWKTVERDGDKPTKLPFQVGGNMAKSDTPDTWTTFKLAESRHDAGGYSGVGYVFAADDPFCGIDLDGCRNPETGEVAEWAKTWIKRFDSYSEVSPSQTGVKIFVRAKSPFATGRKISLDKPTMTNKEPAVELYDHKRYFAVTGFRLAGVSPEIEDRQEQVDAFAAEFWPEQPTQQHDHYSEAAVLERARKYVAKLPPAVSGSSGHNAAFHVACVLVLGFGLPEGDALTLFREYNQLCQPPWSEREVLHKIHQAMKQSGERNYLRNTRQEEWNRVRVPRYECKAPEPELRRTTLKAASLSYLERIREGKQGLIEVGLPDVDYAIGGGVELGELVILAARPSHGKSAVALQAIHAMTLAGMPSVIISEEMSALALGKRVVQFASDVSQEHWETSMPEVLRHLTDHFEDRSECYVVESCGKVDRAAEEIREHVEKYGVKLAVVDYAQLLTASGKTRYEQITNTSIMLRQVASECKIVLLMLCQLNRAIETRASFIPVMSDIRDTGQLEQDADVILFMVWPHRIDPKKDPHEFLVFVAKNRNRPINAPSVKCEFHPSRQMFLSEKPDPWQDRSRGKDNFEPAFDEWNTGN